MENLSNKEEENSVSTIIKEAERIIALHEKKEKLEKEIKILEGKIIEEQQAKEKLKQAAILPELVKPQKKDDGLSHKIVQQKSLFSSLKDSRLIENLITGFAIFLIVIVSSLIFSSIIGIFWPDKDICDVSSNSKEGISFTNENKVKFFPNRVIGTLWTDFYISSSGKYVYDFKRDLEKETISYRDLDNKYVNYFHLHPKYSWWQSYGVFVLLGLGLVLSFFGEDFWRLIFAILSDG